MVNVGIVLLVVVLVILFILVFVAIIAAYQRFLAGSTGGGGSQGALPSCLSQTNISDLIPLDSLTPCFQNGRQTNLYYIGGVDQGKFDFVVAPFGTSPNDVCVGYCSRFDGTTCTGPDYNGRSAQDNFTRCIQQLSSATCIPPTPLATLSGTTLYYPQSVTARTCCNSTNTNCDTSLPA